MHATWPSGGHWLADFFSHRPSRPRIGVIGGMMAYFEAIMPPGFRDERRAHVASVTAHLPDRVDLFDLGLWADQGDDAPIRSRLDDIDIDVLLLIPTMANPPAEIAAMAAEAGVPVVIANAHGLARVDEDYDMAALCRHSTNVGTTMLSAMLRRLSPPVRPIVVSGFLDDIGFHDRLRRAVETAGLARRMQGLKIGRLGLPMTGYDHLGLNADEAAASGFELCDIPLEDWTGRIGSVTDDIITAAIETGLPQNTRWEDTPNLRRAMRQALALDALANEYDLDCGAIACRGPFGDRMENGAISCLATMLLANTGRPFAATGDMVTAVAMLIGRTLGGAALYCELDAVDRSRDAFLVANTGEADAGWCPDDGVCEIRDASVHSGRQVPGVVIRQTLAKGPATMLGATLDRTRSARLSLIAMEGETLNPAKTALKVTAGWFRTSRRPALSAFEDWANAAATHHGALAPGHLAEATHWLGMLSDLPVTAISE